MANEENREQRPSSGHYGYHGHHHRGGTAYAGANDVSDPVCGRMLDPHTTEYKIERPDEWYYFCSAQCRAKYEANPTIYGS